MLRKPQKRKLRWLIRDMKGRDSKLSIQLLRKPACYLSLSIVFFQSANSLALTIDHFDYPELSVVPRASARLQTEAEVESSHQLLNVLPIQVSGLATFITGVAALGDAVNPNSGYAGIITGGAWLISSTVLALAYHPYQSGNASVQPLPQQSERQQLTRERAAEEYITSAAVLAERLKWASVLTNLGASIYMAASVGNSQNGIQNTNTLSRGFAFGSAALALLPMLFRPRWSQVSDQQSDYKKRIYAPVAGGILFFEPITKSYVPGLAISMIF